MTESATPPKKAKPATVVAKPSATRKPATAAVKPVPAPKMVSAKPAKKPKKNKHAEVKKNVVRDSFTMPHDDYVKIAELKQAALKAGMHLKKSEVLRAGLHALCRLSATQLKEALTGLEKIKTGRPKKAAE